MQEKYLKLYSFFPKLFLSALFADAINSDSVQQSDVFTPLRDFEVVSELRKEYQKWVKSLTAKEKRAIRKYTKNSFETGFNKFYQRLNAMLRGEIPEDKTLRRYANLISYALKKKPLEHDIVCYRTISFNPFIGLKVGDVFEGKQFISTTVVKTKTMKGDFHMVIRASKGTNGAYIESLSRVKKQREFLFDKDCKYRILSIEKDTLVLEALNG